MKTLPRFLGTWPQALLAACVVTWAATAVAEQAASEPALAKSFKDKGLAWGDCPPFLPKGCGIAVLHGDPAKPNVDIFFKVPGGARIAKHTHTSAERMVLVSGKLDVVYDGQPGVTLTPGMYAYGPAGRPHEATCHKGPPCVLFIAFESPLDAVPYATEAKQ